MKVEVCHAVHGRATRVEVTLDAGATAAEAVRCSNLVEALGLDPPTLTLAVFGRRVQGSEPLREGDRVELLRALQVDPKEARRRRASLRKV